MHRQRGFVYSVMDLMMFCLLVLVLVLVLSALLLTPFKAKATVHQMSLGCSLGKRVIATTIDVKDNGSIYWTAGVGGFGTYTPQSGEVCSARVVEVVR